MLLSARRCTFSTRHWFQASAAASSQTMSRWPRPGWLTSRQVRPPHSHFLAFPCGPAPGWVLMLSPVSLQVSIENMGLYEDLSSAKDVREVTAPWGLSLYVQQSQSGFLGL